MKKILESLMLNRKNEYEKMASVEIVHWWYESLHRQVINTIKANFSTKNVSILDTGCGTGGMMLKLKECGYHNITGLELSEEGVGFCRNRGLTVDKGDLRNIDSHFPERQFDVIINNDVLYFLKHEEIKKYFTVCKDLLKKDGLLICNFPSLQAFGGIHDISVGIEHRFSKSKVRHLVNWSEYDEVQNYYWPFILSPVIFLVRLIQRIKIRVMHDVTISSDIDLPPLWINKILIHICSWDLDWIHRYRFGSSLFCVIKKK